MMKKLMLFISIVLLVVTSVPSAPKAAIVKPKLLVIYDNVQPVLSLANYQVEFIRMKTFVASREQIDGKYDAIYIAPGKYNSQLARHDSSRDMSGKAVQNRITANNTVAVMNDLTVNKANEIINGYVNRGLPVYLDSYSVKNQVCLAANTTTMLFTENQCVLKTKLGNLSQSNVKYITNETEIMRNWESVRPRIAEISSKGTIRAGEPFTINFSLYSTNTSQLTAKLSYDYNFDGDFTDNEIAEVRPVNMLANGTKFTWAQKLPRGYTGIRSYKLEVINREGLKDYVTGTIKFEGESPTINVLQVYATTGKLVGYDNPLLSGYLSGSQRNEVQVDGVTFKIDMMSIGEFNNNFNGRGYNQLQSYSMLMFGFQDSYSGDITNNLSQHAALDEFIRSGKSIFLSHDLLINPSSRLFQKLYAYSGQTFAVNRTSDATVKSLQDKYKNPNTYFLNTDLGYGAPVTSSSVNKVNSGLVTTYPYMLQRNREDIALTHSQYYALNINDPRVKVWYNLATTGIDENDSYNHYYIYSVDNMTYTGAGHVSSLSDMEKRLFINTMYQSFFSSNHAPQVTIEAPKDTAIYSIGQKLQVSYEVNDLDFNDRYLSTTIALNDKVVMTKDRVMNGSVIEETYDLPKEEGDVKVTITARDSRGATTTKDVLIKVIADNQVPKLSRWIDQQQTLLVGGTPERTLTMNYNIAQTPMTADELRQLGIPIANADSKVTLTNVKFTEKLPDGLEYVAANGTVLQTPIAASGNTVTIQLPPITYEKSPVDGKFSIAAPYNGAIDFTLTVKAIKQGDYTLAPEQSTLSYTVKDSSKTINFPRWEISARQALTDLLVPDKIHLYLDEIVGKSIDTKILPSTLDASQIVIQYTTNDSATISLNQAIVLPKQVGEASVTVTATDAYNVRVSKQVKVIVEERMTEFTVPERMTLGVGQTKTVAAKIMPETLGESIIWTVEGQEAQIKGATKGRAVELQGLKPGTTTLTATIMQQGQKVTKSIMITVVELKASPTSLIIEKGSSKQVSVTMLPKDSDATTLVAAVKDGNIATISEDVRTTGEASMTIRGTEVGQTTLTIKTTDGSNQQMTVAIEVVYAPLMSIQFKQPYYKVPINEVKNLGLELQYNPDNQNIDRRILWTIKTPSGTVMNNSEWLLNGVLQPKSLGNFIVEVTAMTDATKQAKTQIYILPVTDDGTGGAGTNPNRPKNDFRW